MSITALPQCEPIEKKIETIVINDEFDEKGNVVKVCMTSTYSGIAECKDQIGTIPFTSTDTFCIDVSKAKDPTKR